MFFLILLFTLNWFLLGCDKLVDDTTQEKAKNTDSRVIHKKCNFKKKFYKDKKLKYTYDDSKRLKIDYKKNGKEILKKTIYDGKCRKVIVMDAQGNILP